MNSPPWSRIVRYSIAVIVLGGLGWFLSREVHRNWTAVSRYKLVLSWRELGLAVALGLMAFLVETRAWQRAINGSLGRDAIRFGESVAIVNTSGVLKYLPGRIWTYGAQLLWLERRGVATSAVVYANLICLWCGVIISTLLGGAFLVVRHAPGQWAWAWWAALIILHGAGLFAGPKFIAVALGMLRRILRREIAVTPIRPALLAELAALYAVGWGGMGVAGYYAGLGVGLDITPQDVAAITAAMSVSWMVGYLSALTPGGLGVREGLMFLMLDRLGAPQAAVILPIVSRLLYLSVEVLLGAVGVALGIKLRVFNPPAKLASLATPGQPLAQPPPRQRTGDGDAGA